MYRRIHVIVNPAAGQKRPVLDLLQRAFEPAGVEWEVRQTRQPGDARRFAAEALTSGVDAVSVYGGDGTIKEAASAMIGSQVPLAILPGGTANVMSVELGIPSDLEEACALVCGQMSTIRTIDVGQLQDDYFLLRVGLGFEAEMVRGADRELKERLGVLAYGVSALQALKHPTLSRYRLTLDGEQIETEGVTCIVANVGSLGQGKLTLAPSIDVGDGVLDVVVLRKANLPSLLSVAASVVAGREEAEPLEHWQVREVTVEADPPQPIQVDGEPADLSCVSARVVPSAVRVIAPAPTGQRQAS